MTVEFAVEDVEAELQPEATEPEVSGPAAVVVASWTPEEAVALCLALFNVGVLVWGPEWAAHPAEFRASGATLPPVLDRWLPKGAGAGLVSIGLGLAVVAGEMAGAGVRRWPLIRRGPRPLWATTPQATPDQVQQEPEQEDQPDTGGNFHFGRDSLRVLSQTPPAAAPDGLGNGL
jgi:hypothetical protein